MGMPQIGQGGCVGPSPPDALDESVDVMGPSRQLSTPFHSATSIVKRSRRRFPAAKNVGRAPLRATLAGFFPNRGATLMAALAPPKLSPCAEVQRIPSRR